MSTVGYPNGRLGGRGSRADRIAEIEARIAELVEDRSKGDWGGANAESYPKMDELTELHHELYRLKEGLPASHVRSSPSRNGATRSASPVASPRKPGRLPEVSHERQPQSWRLGGLRTAQFRAVAAEKQRQVVLGKHAYKTISAECEQWDGQAKCGGTLTTGDDGIVSWRPVEITGATSWDVPRNDWSLGVPRDIDLKWFKTAGCWHTHPSGGAALSRADINMMVTLGQESLHNHPGSGEFAAFIATANVERGDWHQPAITSYIFRKGDDGWTYEPAALTVKT